MADLARVKQSDQSDGASEAPTAGADEKKMKKWLEELDPKALGKVRDVGGRCRRRKARPGPGAAQTVGEVRRPDGAPVGRIVPLARIEPDPGSASARTRKSGRPDRLDSRSGRARTDPGAADPPDRPGREELPPVTGIISGERRFRAARRAGLREIPLIEMEVSPRDALEIALVENLQRADLTPFEEAEGLRTLVERHGYTHDRVAARGRAGPGSA